MIINREMGQMLPEIRTCGYRYEYVSRKVNLIFINYNCIDALFSFHNKLKTSYLNGKVNRRVDVLLEVLLKIEHDQYFQYEMKHRLQHSFKYKTRQWKEIIAATNVGWAFLSTKLRYYFCYYNEYEQVIVCATCTCHEVVDENQWHIPSQSGTNQSGYTVCRVATVCPETNCNMKCVAPPVLSSIQMWQLMLNTGVAQSPFHENISTVWHRHQYIWTTWLNP